MRGAALMMPGAAVAAAWLGATTMAAAAEPQGDDGAAAWRAEFDAIGWLLGMDGTVGVRGHTAAAHASFLDIIEDSDSVAGFAGRIEAGYGRFAGFVDGMYDEVGIEGASGPGGLADIDITFAETVLDFGAMYRVVESQGSRACPTITDVDIYAGGRFAALSLELAPAQLPAKSGDRGWTDPIVGAKVGIALDERFRLAINGDVGGFGLASNFTWSATALVVLDFTLGDAPTSILLGYRAIGWDHADGEAEERFTWDVIQHGAVIGFALRF